LTVAKIPQQGAPGQDRRIGEPFNPFGEGTGLFLSDRVLLSSGLTPVDKVVYSQLRRFAYRSGLCYPSVRRIARQLSIPERTVQRSLKRLETDGWIRIDPQFRSNGSRTVNAYRFLWHPALATLPSKETAPGAGDKMAPGAGDKVALGGVKAAPLEVRNLRSVNFHNSSSNPPMAKTESSAVAAGIDLAEFPATSSKVRQYFPRTADPVLRRIIGSARAVFPEATDSLIAGMIAPVPDQKTPGLFEQIVAEQLRRFSAEPPGDSTEKCPTCKGAGVVWDAEGVVDWCPSDCSEAQEQKRRNPDFVDECNALNAHTTARRPEQRVQ